jgi:hypothetical protein
VEIRVILRAVAATAVVIAFTGCGGGGSAASDRHAVSRGAPSESPTPASQMDGCSGERYAHPHLPSKYEHVLRKADWKYFTAWARVGQVAVVNVVSVDTVDSHERAVVFIRGNKIIGADAATPSTARFDARICSVGNGAAETGYWYRIGPTGPDGGCPAPRPAFATVRWRVTANRAVPLDHIPGHCK